MEKKTQGKSVPSTSKIPPGPMDDSSELCCAWDLIDVLAEKADWHRWAINNTVTLLEEDNTVPFIARYRKEQTNNMDAEKIRQVKEELEQLRAVQAKAATVYQAVLKLGKVKPQWRESLASAQTLAEVEHLYAPFKPGSKRSLAERARELGLEPVTKKLITNPWEVNLNQLIQPNKEGLSTIKEIKTGIQHILADMISKDKVVMDAVRDWCKKTNVMVTSSRVKDTKNKSDEKKIKTEGLKIKSEDFKGKGGGQDEAEKYHLYFDYKCNIKTIKPHQVLAINRGCAKKFLSMKIVIPDWVEHQLMRLGQQKFIHPRASEEARKLIQDSIKDAYNRLIEPLIVRNFKADLTKTAEKASVEVFASNLKRLLLTPPVRGKIVLGVDPGFKHGCKYCVVSPTGQVLDTGVFYPHGYNSNKQSEASRIAQTVCNHRCETIAIGNGTACRETESFFSDLIKRGAFRPLKVMFCIVSECGASVYSASPEAALELPNLDVSIRGAVSIARRLQDPMAELVKIEPKHIGVGMYQHDIGEKQLKVALDGVVEDCVSFVGVDLNVASEVLLRRIAGLSTVLSKRVIEHRDTKGPFINRSQLNDIKGLGPKTFRQCAGFVRVLSQTSVRAKVKKLEVKAEAAEAPEEPTKKRKATTKAGGSKSKKAKTASSQEPDNLDMTSIHPESYQIAERFLSMLGLAKENIGSTQLTGSVTRFMAGKSMEKLAADLDTGVPTLTLIVDALKQPIGHDIRDEFEKPLFKEGVRQFSDLRVGEMLTGRVTNTVHFGAFVDVGVGRDGLVHTSSIQPWKINGKKSLELGDKINVKVDRIDFNKNQLGLKLESLAT